MADITRVNKQITAPEVFLIKSDGSQLGVTVLHEALSAARHERLDLVEVAPAANPPVCRIMDYKRHQAERKRLLDERRRLDGDEPGDDEPDGGAGDRAPRRPLGPSPSSGQALGPLPPEK